jgi:two-component system nitrate/nitrite response regulator NarL
MTGPAVTTTAAAGHSPTRRRPLRVVVADDHPLFRQGIVRALEAAGDHVVAEAADGDAALAAIAAGSPDVALVDVSMPGLDGIDVVRAVARRRLGVPVVLLSAFRDESLVTAGLAAGAADYVCKTADRQEILHALEAVAGSVALAPHRLAAARVTPTGPGASPPPRRPPGR